jgi:hypothetical protein
MIGGINFEGDFHERIESCNSIFVEIRLYFEPHFIYSFFERFIFRQQVRNAAVGVGCAAGNFGKISIVFK